MPSDIYYSEPISRGFYWDTLSTLARERSLRDIIAMYRVYGIVLIRGIEGRYTYICIRKGDIIIIRPNSPLDHVLLSRTAFTHTHIPWILAPVVARSFLYFCEWNMDMHTYTCSCKHILFRITAKNYRFNNTDNSLHMILYDFRS